MGLLVVAASAPEREEKITLPRVPAGAGFNINGMRPDILAEWGVSCVVEGSSNSSEAWVERVTRTKCRLLAFQAEKLLEIERTGF